MAGRLWCELASEGVKGTDRKNLFVDDLSQNTEKTALTLTFESLYHIHFSPIKEKTDRETKRSPRVYVCVSRRRRQLLEQQKSHTTNIIERTRCSDQRLHFLLFSEKKNKTVQRQ